MPTVPITITVPDLPTLAVLCASVAPGQQVGAAALKAAIVEWLVTSAQQSQQAIATAAALATVAAVVPPTLS